MTRVAHAVLALAIVACVLVPGCGDAFLSHEKVSYDPRFGDATIMDIFTPAGDGPYPGVMLVHGGSWSGGDRGEYTDAAKRLARSGYVAATIEYRLTPAGQYPIDVQDCLCALAFLRLHAIDYRLDPARIAAWGYSAGGHLVSLIGAAADEPSHAPDCDAAGGKPVAPPAAVVAGAAPVDFRGWVVSGYLGGSEKDIPDVWVRASPITHVRPGMPPYLFINGDADLVVPPDMARRMRDAMLADGDDATLLVVTGGGHLLNTNLNGEWNVEVADLTPEAWAAIVPFLDRTVGRTR
jgi:acetyl esterase/lipase